VSYGTKIPRSHTSYFDDILGKRAPRTGVALARYTFLAIATKPSSFKACMSEERATSANLKDEQRNKNMNKKTISQCFHITEHARINVGAWAGDVETRNVHRNFLE
jgi:hypothetical protein